MIDYGELKKKFKPKDPKDAEKSQRTKRAVKRIAREYEQKRAALGLDMPTPALRRGPLFYGIIILLLVVIGSFVVPQFIRGGIPLGKKRIERADLAVHKAMNSLSIALGRYKFHVGEYPSTEEGLAVLAFRRPNEIRRIRAKHPGWDGPYVNHIVKDPWGNDYVYETRPEGGHPVLYSKGPDGRAGTLDDILPEQLSFDAACRDTTWTNNWAPCELRGIVVAPDEETRQRVQEEMKKYDAKK